MNIAYLFDSNKLKNSILVKDKITGYKDVIISKTILKKIENNNLINKEFSKYVKTFINTLMEKNAGFDFTLFMNNISTLNIVVTDKLIKPVSGRYDAKENIIYISEEDFLSGRDLGVIIYHELLHMLSSDGKRNGDYVGFRGMIGKGINEGYTEVLLSRYFDIQSNAYIIERRIAFLLEVIIGREKMEKLYSKNGFWGLVNEISKYTSDESVAYTLISDIDCVLENDLYLGVNRENKRKEFISWLRNVLITLMDTFINKQMVTLSSKEDINLFFKEIEKFLFVERKGIRLFAPGEIEKYKEHCYEMISNSRVTK